MDAKAFRLTLKHLDWTQGKTAEKCGVTRVSVYRWANNKVPVPKMVETLLTLAIEVKTLREIMARE